MKGRKPVEHPSDSIEFAPSRLPTDRRPVARFASHCVFSETLGPQDGSTYGRTGYRVGRNGFLGENKRIIVKNSLSLYLLTYFLLLSPTPFPVQPNFPLSLYAYIRPPKNRLIAFGRLLATNLSPGTPPERTNDPLRKRIQTWQRRRSIQRRSRPSV